MATCWVIPSYGGRSGTRVANRAPTRRARVLSIGQSTFTRRCRASRFMSSKSTGSFTGCWLSSIPEAASVVVWPLLVRESTTTASHSVSWCTAEAKRRHTSCALGCEAPASSCRPYMCAAAIVDIDRTARGGMKAAT